MPPFERPEVRTKEYRWVSDEKVILDAAAVNGVGNNVDVSQFRHVCVVIIGAASPDFTLKCAGSFKHLDDVNFASAASASNPWDFIAMYDYEDASITDGDVGIVFADSGDIRQFEINTNGIRTLNFIISNYVAGTATVLLYGVNNQ